MTQLANPNGQIVPGEPEGSKKVLAPVSVGNRGVQFTSMADVFRFASAVVTAGLAPRGLQSPEAVMVAIQFGLELGMAPMAALRSVYVVNNRPTLWGDMMLALCMGSPSFDQTRFREWTEGEGEQLVAHCICARRAATEVRRSFSMADARAAGLASKDLYKSYPKRMCQYRARAFALRDTFPDVLQGVHAAEEFLADDASPFQADAVEAVVRRVVPKPLVATNGATAELNAQVKRVERVDSAKSAPEVAADVIEEADVEIDDLPFKSTGTGAAVEPPVDRLRAIARAREYIALWAESSGRPTPSAEEMDKAIERYAVAIKFGPVSDWIEDRARVEEFLSRARSTTVVWSRYLRSDTN